jgi:Subtilase family
MSDKKHLIIYFQPRQLLFHAHGNLSGLQGKEKIQRLIEWANKVAADWANKRPERGKVNISAFDDVFGFNSEEVPDLRKQRSFSRSQTNNSSVVTVPQTEPQTYARSSYKSPQVKIPPSFSLAFANVQSDKWPALPSPGPDGILVLDPGQQEEQKTALNELLDLANFLDKNRKSAPVKLEVVSPNWLVSSNPPSEPGGTGGPGGKPSPVNNADINKYHIHLPSKSALSQAFNNVSEPGAGEGVVVAILDTAYHEEQLEDKYKTWVLDRLEMPHPHIKTLLGKEPFARGGLRRPDGRLNVYIDPAVEAYCVPGIEIYGHDYNMTDHGLFVAGIINSLAPKAELHLYQVLNKYGLGDLLSIGRALEKVTNDFQGRQLIVNLSLTMNMPLEEGHLKANDDFGMGQSILSYKPSFLMHLICGIVCWIFEWLLHLPCPSFCESWLDRQARPFEWISDLVYALDSRVIAAAGNDSKNRASRLGALYPAALERVFGVGALARGLPLRPADYSNLADQPASKGITTLGGEEGEKQGILGVYVGEFPEDENGSRPNNENGWAWWAGTSFATPIISGITAAVLGNLSTGGPGATVQPSTEGAITELYNAQSPTTPDDEDIFAVDQF